ncbi:ABC transporter substrate-binding protein [Actinoplanes sp. NPDC051859]|uniref:ABC transporter substrate-binding protein n=1 Tax=Actinoplanes sp. NPDC051859 TaxID=3363909 RepID=UPI0037B7D806
MRRLLTAAIAATALMLGGCGGSGTETGADTKPTASAGAAAGTFPATAGGVTLDKRPEKIVSLAPTATEMLFAIDAGKQVAAVDDQSNYPADAPKSDLSGFKPNAEAIAAKNPDLVVLSDDLNKIVEQLTKLKIPVLVTPAAKTLDDSYRQITELGTLTGHPAEATALVEQMKTQIDKIVKSVPARTAELTYYYELDPTFFTVTSKTFVGSVFTMFGLKNVADGAKTDYPQLSQEALIAADPDMVFLADSKCCAQSPDTVAKRKGWAGIAAVKNKQVVALDDDIASRWGPRVVDLVQSVADAVAKAP